MSRKILELRITEVCNYLSLWVVRPLFTSIRSNNKELITDAKNISKYKQKSSGNSILRKPMYPYYTFNNSLYLLNIFIHKARTRNFDILNFLLTRHGCIFLLVSIGRSR